MIAPLSQDAEAPIALRIRHGIRCKPTVDNRQTCLSLSTLWRFRSAPWRCLCSTYLPDGGRSSSWQDGYTGLAVRRQGLAERACRLWKMSGSVSSSRLRYREALRTGAVLLCRMSETRKSRATCPRQTDSCFGRAAKRPTFCRPSTHNSLHVANNLRQQLQTAPLGRSAVLKQQPQPQVLATSLGKDLGKP